MGTNYYAESDNCKHCGRGDRPTHITKSLTSWQGWSEDNPSPWGPIRSVADWRRVLRENNLTVRDEYGDVHDRAEFLARVAAVPVAARRRQYDWMVASHHDSSGEWLDGEGFSFTDAWFS